MPLSATRSRWSHLWRGSGAGGSCRTDSGSQVHKSQINQNAAGRTRELQRAVAASALLSTAELGSDSIPDPIRFKPSRFRGLPVRQRVARLRLLIYTSCGAAAAAAPGPATATAASATASEVQRSRRVAATATAAWKFIYFTAMIWQYFNGNRISPFSTHFSLSLSPLILLLSFSLSLSALLFLYTLLALLSLYSPCSLLPHSLLLPHFALSWVISLYSPHFSRLFFPYSSPTYLFLHSPFPTLLTLLSPLFTLLPTAVCSLSHLFPLLSLHSYSTLHSPCSTLLLISLYTLSPPVAFLSFRSCCRFVAAVVRAWAADNQGQQTRVPHPQHPIPIPMPSCVLTSCKLWTCSSSSSWRINRTASVEITFNLQ